MSSGRRSRLWVCAAAGLAVALSGCAGAGSEPTTPPATTVATVPPGETTTTIREVGDTPPVTTVETMTIDGVERTYLLHVPSGLPAAGAPLVVDMHGLGSTPQGQDETSGMAALGNARGFVVAQPAARGALPTWNPQPGAPGGAADVAFLRALVDDVAGEASIDRGAVFATGFSNGGGMAHRLACDAADVFAAIGTVSGQYPLVDSCDPSQPVAVVAFHGTTDLVVPFRGAGELLPDVMTWVRDWTERLDCSPVPERNRTADDVISDLWTGCAGDEEVLFLTIEGGGHAWPGSARAGLFATTRSIDASALMWEFFIAHRR